MGICEYVGKVRRCSECHKEKKIGLKYPQGTDAKRKNHSPYLKCKDCILQDLKKALKNN
jgi:hypothetical protein